MDIITRRARARIFDHIHTPFSHTHFCINEAVGQADKDFLVVERAASQPKHAL